ncbi:hypothetical protein MTO96_013537 [Rhipicephalus appendiculatus]
MRGVREAFLLPSKWRGVLDSACVSLIVSQLWQPRSQAPERERRYASAAMRVPGRPSWPFRGAGQAGRARSSPGPITPSSTVRADGVTRCQRRHSAQTALNRLEARFALARNGLSLESRGAPWVPRHGGD